MSSSKERYDFIMPIIHQEEEEDFCIDFAKKIMALNCTILFVSTSKKFDTICKSHNLDYVNIDEECDHLTNIDYDEEASRIVNKYNLINIYNLYFGELTYKYFKVDESFLYHKVVLYFIYLERLFGDVKFSHVLNNRGGEIIRQVLDNVGKMSNANVIYFQISPFQDRSFFFPGPAPVLDHALFQNDRLMDSATLTKYLSNFTSTDGFLGYYPSLNFKNLSPIDRIRSMYSTLKVLKISFFSGLSIILSRYLKRILLLNLFYKNMEQSKNIVDSCHFFYFPLQLFTESRTTIISPECFEQAFYVESASKSLPEGCKLLVKEHPDWVGEFPLGTYRRIKKLKNVIMINPKMLPKELIHKSDGVITINGSVGYEGILLGKPVTAFGKEYYTGLNLTQDVSDLTKLGFVLKNTTHNTHEDVLHFINLVYCNTGKGIFGLYQEKNVDDFVSSLDSYIKTKQMSN